MRQPSPKSNFSSSPPKAHESWSFAPSWNGFPRLGGGLRLGELVGRQGGGNPLQGGRGGRMVPRRGQVVVEVGLDQVARRRNAPLVRGGRFVKADRVALGRRLLEIVARLDRVPRDADPGLVG